MRIKNLFLENFRNYPSLDISLDYDIVFFLGENGTGKTSILEAVSLMNQLKSFRKVPNQELVRWDSSFFRVDIKYEKNGQEEKLHIGYGKNLPSQEGTPQRILKINREKVDKIQNFIGRFQTVIFSPDDIKIIDTDPESRRKYIDMVLSVVNPGYLSSLQEYQAALKNRTRALKSGFNETYIRSVDKILAQKGADIVRYRHGFILDYRERVNHYVTSISEGRDSWSMNYYPSAVADTPEKYFQILEEARMNDQRLKATTRGVHRDRIIFYPLLSGVKKDVKTIASQGQKRTLVLSLKMAQYDYIRGKIMDAPVLLIDDVFNELDVKRRKSIISFLKTTGQAIITTTDTAGMEDFLSERGKEIRIKTYSIFPENGVPVVRSNPEQESVSQ